ncbi:hypothetical protein [Chlorobium phaeovibrioides]|nr:hypothetical protein [Chlorobium phaeovibrioides]
MTERRRVVPVLMLAFLAVLCLPRAASAWHDRTHVAIAWAAGFDRWYSAAAPDVAKLKYPCGAYEGKNHYSHNSAGEPVTPELVSSQVKQYDRADDLEGHLYGAIIASLAGYRKLEAAGKFADYHLVYCAHYIGDLSMPLHNVPYDAFNKARHHANDGIIESTAFRDAAEIRSRCYTIEIENDDDLSREIARIGEISRQLALKMKREERNMSSREALSQAVHSASLFRAVLLYAGRPLMEEGGLLPGAEKAER